MRQFFFFNSKSLAIFLEQMRNFRKIKNSKFPEKKDAHIFSFFFAKQINAKLTHLGILALYSSC